MKSLAYKYVIGTGGIGKGILYRFLENETLGRNESRMALLTDTKDYCKLHIILHYIAVYTEGKIPIYAIGRIGDDHSGYEIKSMMERYGINTENVLVDNEAATMFSTCFIYPNSEGGNITSINSASQKLTIEDIDTFFNTHAIKGKGVIISAPEVPVMPRARLLEWGRKLNCLNAASISSSEVMQCIKNDMFPNIDFLSINRDEMESIIKNIDNKYDISPDHCYDILRSFNPGMQVAITLGPDGSYIYWNGKSKRVPAIWKQVENSAGAGDCYFATMIAAMIYGVPFYDSSEGTGIEGLASLASSLKVTCNDTIDTEINRQYLLEQANKIGLRFTKKIRSLFFEEAD